MHLGHIISKTSLKSSPDSMNREQSEKFNLFNEIELLKETVSHLNNTLANQDATVKTLSNEKQNLYLELKTIQRTNRNLKQQLDDEREFHSKEKDYLIEEVMKCTRNSSFNSQDLILSNNINLYQEKEAQSQSNEYEMLQQQLKIKDEVIYTICSKYLKISYSKRYIQKKICLLQRQTQKMCENIVYLLQENQDTLDKLINKLLVFSKISPLCKKYLSDIKSYGDLHYENIQLKFSILSYKANSFLNQKRSRKCTSQSDNSAFSTSEERVKSHLNFKGQQISRAKCKRCKIYKNLHSNGFLKSVSDSCLL